MRLIDADDLISQAREWQKDKDRFAQDVSEHCIIILDHAKTVDAVPVIRCKDCALWDDADSEHLVGYCTEGDGEKITFRNEWCCWAERKEE